jgi:hypothetical protein
LRKFDEIYLHKLDSSQIAVANALFKVKKKIHEIVGDRNWHVSVSLLNKSAPDKQYTPPSVQGNCIDQHNKM